MSGEIKTRAECLYEYLLQCDGWVRQSAVYFALRGLYPPLEQKDFHNTTARRQMSEDIKRINNDPRYAKIIIHGEEGIKIANDDEAADYLLRRAEEAKRMLRQVGILRDKVGGAKIRMEM